MSTNCQSPARCSPPGFYTFLALLFLFTFPHSSLDCFCTTPSDFSLILSFFFFFSPPLFSISTFFLQLRSKLCGFSCPAGFTRSFLPAHVSPPLRPYFRDTCFYGLSVLRVFILFCPRIFPPCFLSISLSASHPLSPVHSQTGPPPDCLFPGRNSPSERPPNPLGPLFQFSCLFYLLGKGFQHPLLSKVFFS